MKDIFSLGGDNIHFKEGKSKVSDIERISRYLFEELCEERFDAGSFITHLRAVLNSTTRVYYSVFSKMIFSLDEKQQGLLDTNLEYLVDFTGTEKFDEMFPKGTASFGDKKIVEKVIYKLWDHSRLAENQISEIKKDTFMDKFKKEKVEIENSIKKEGQKLNRELISLVGIFTAMAFLVFGGLNSLSSILVNSVKGVPILNISVVCLLWGICVYNMIYLFMFLVAKITGNDISTNRESTNVFRRHVIFFTGNAVLISSLFIAAWLYFIKIDFRGWYSKLYEKWNTNTIWLVPLIAVLCVFAPFLLSLFISWIIDISREKKSKKEQKDIQ